MIRAQRNCTRGSMAPGWMIGIAVLASLAGCGPTQALQKVTGPGGNKALVYFIRKSYPPYIHVARLIVDGTLAATIANNDYVAVNVPVGMNRIRVVVKDAKTFSFDMPIKQADTRYVVLTGKVTPTGESVSGRKITVDLKWHVWAHPVSRKQGQALVSEFRRRLL